MAQDIHFPPFNYRVAAAIVHDGRVLLSRGESDDFWLLPGGRCKLHEDARHSLHREIKEELDADIEVGRLLWLCEQFFENNGRLWHELGLIFEVQLTEGYALQGGMGEFDGAIDTGVQMKLKWAPVNELESLELYPTILRAGLANLPRTTQHIVENELER